ncbi:hypothetical protein BDW59DRAFT_148899 [Aspergillus cavernicola]|uniref:CBM1 domain-containing protein n=1 Tax=Aspergillus cavernicola TaxID=176166 RepID=A0ABR4I659_9EURO
MKLISIIPLLASLPALSSAYVTLGTACSGAGYDCTDTYHSIGVCNGRNWQLSADCGEGFCVWPAGDPTPWCNSS